MKRKRYSEQQIACALRRHVTPASQRETLENWLAWASRSGATHLDDLPPPWRRCVEPGFTPWAMACRPPQAGLVFGRNEEGGEASSVVAAFNRRKPADIDRR
jgi:hypothetical protein